MKITKKKVIYFILEFMFVCVVPLVLVILNYSNIGNTKEETGFKITITGIMLLIMALFVLKKMFINRITDNINHQVNHLISELKIENDEYKISNIERNLKNLKTVQAILNSILPLLLFVCFIICAKALESQIIKLSSVLGLMFISYLFGFIFAILNSREIYSKNIKR